jgi:acetyl-CoA acetyltransferase
MLATPHIVAQARPPHPISDKPPANGHFEPLHGVLVTVAESLLGDSTETRALIDGVYVGSMGVLPRDGAGRLHPRHLAAHVAQRCGLGQLVHAPDGGYGRLVSVWGTSDAGATAFERAYRDVTDGRCHTALVLAGDQLFNAPPPGRSPEDQRRRDREDLQAAIRTVLDPSESNAHGLTMLSVGDALMDALVAGSRHAATDWQRLLRAVALAKVERAQRLSGAMASAREAADPAKRLTADAYDALPTIGLWLRAFDVGAPANGASGLLLTSRADVRESALERAGAQASLEVIGCAAAQAPVAFAHRSAPLVRSQAARAALSLAFAQSGRTAAEWWRDERVMAVFHDAFPSVELGFLYAWAELAGEPSAHDEVLCRWLDGRANPFGGLVGAGHALGNSGLLQLCGALEQSQRGDSEALPEAWVVTSVGSALTHVTCTLLRCSPPASPPAAFGWGAQEQAEPAVPRAEHPGHCAGWVVEGRTTVCPFGEPAVVYWVSKDGRLGLASSAPHELWPVGSLVELTGDAPPRRVVSGTSMAESTRPLSRRVMTQLEQVEAELARCGRMTRAE